MSLNKGRRMASRSSVHEASQIENEENDECRECKIKLRETDRALHCDFCDNIFCYKCTKVTAKMMLYVRAHKRRGLHGSACTVE